MKYHASWDQNGNSGPVAAVYASGECRDEEQARSHARAMLEVQRAAKAWALPAADVTQAAKTCLRLERAVDRLKRIEKEVERG